MNELTKHCYIPGYMTIREPTIPGYESHGFKREDHEPLSPAAVLALQQQFASDMEQTAPDLKSYDLATQYAQSLFAKLTDGGANTVDQLRHAGSAEFYGVGKNTLGPLAVHFVDDVLQQCHGKAIFPARDATPFFYIAKTLKTLAPDKYPLEVDNIHNPVFNRKLWGIDDEQDEGETVSVTDPMVQKLLAQLGFWSGNQRSFVEVGCWGSMIDQLKRAMQKGKLPQEDFSVYFLYTHLPEHIYGFMNHHGKGIPDDVLETIADTWEAFPKFFKRPTKLVEENGIVKASLDNQMIDSPFLVHWSQAALQGVVDAAAEFVQTGKKTEPKEELHRLWQLSQRAQQGEFTGVLPTHTETWSEGDAWKQQWPWGKISPLQD